MQNSHEILKKPYSWDLVAELKIVDNINGLRNTDSAVINESYGSGYLVVVQDVLSANPVMSFNASTFETSITFGTASAPWFADYQHIAYWFYLLCVVLLSLWLIYSAVLAFLNPEHVAPVRETRGFSRAQTGDALTAIIPLCWSVTMLMHASTHSNNFDENTDTCSMSLTIVAYQWGWNYYFPEDTIKQLRKVNESEINYNEFLAQSVPSITTQVIKSQQSSSSTSDVKHSPERVNIIPNAGRTVDVTSSTVIVPSSLSYTPNVNYKLANLLNYTGNKLSLENNINQILNTMLTFDWAEGKSAMRVFYGALLPQYVEFRNKISLLGEFWKTNHRLNKRWIIRTTYSASILTGGKHLPSNSGRNFFNLSGGDFTTAIALPKLNKETVTLDISSIIVPFNNISLTYETNKSTAELGAWNLLVIRLAQAISNVTQNIDATALTDNSGVFLVKKFYCVESFKRVTNLLQTPRKSVRRMLVPTLSEDVDQDVWSKDIQLMVSTTRQPNPISRVDSTNFAGGLVVRMRVNAGVVVPSDVPMHIICGSKDVIHSWAIPGLGIKIDCIPGYNCHRRLMIRWRGLFWGQCMEVCGRYHHWMPILVKVTHVDMFVLWLSSQGV